LVRRLRKNALAGGEPRRRKEAEGQRRTTQRDSQEKPSRGLKRRDLRAPKGLIDGCVFPPTAGRKKGHFKKGKKMGLKEISTVVDAGKGSSNRDTFPGVSRDQSRLESFLEEEISRTRGKKKPRPFVRESRRIVGALKGTTKSSTGKLETNWGLFLAYGFGFVRQRIIPPNQCPGLLDKRRPETSKQLRTGGSEMLSPMK